jgi:hypothetical protein
MVRHRTAGAHGGGTPVPDRTCAEFAAWALVQLCVLQELCRPGCDPLAGGVPDSLELVGGQLFGIVTFPL